MKSIEYALDRMGGKPPQSVELSGGVSHGLTEADKADVKVSIEKIRALVAEHAAWEHVDSTEVLGERGE